MKYRAIAGFLVFSVFLLFSCSKFDIKQGPFSVYFKENASITANIEVTPLPSGFSLRQPISGGQKLNLDLFFDVPKITVYGDGTTKPNKIWNYYKVIPGGFDYTIEKAKSYDFVLNSSSGLVASKFATGEVIYLHEASSLLGDFRDAYGKTAVEIKVDSSNLTYTLPNGAPDGNSLPTLPTTAPPLNAKLYTASPSFYFSKDASGKEKIDKLTNGTSLTFVLEKFISGDIISFTVTLK